MTESEFLLKLKDARKDTVDLFVRTGAGHLPSALSTLEIIVTLFHGVMKIDPARPEAEERDRFILSKGHGCLGLYAVLGRLGYFSMDEWDRVGRPGGILGGHPSSKIPGVEISTGSLGLAPSVAVGMALHGRLKKLPFRTFCLLGDGECNEGSVWEAAMAGAHRRLEKLYFLVDYNGYQANGRTESVCDPQSLREKWMSFGWRTWDIDLRKDPAALLSFFSAADRNPDRPVAIICRTSKGMGIPFIENDPSWHNKTRLTDEEKRRLIASVSG